MTTHWWFPVVRETVLLSAGNGMQFMGVHQGSGQSSRPLYVQGRHLLLSRAVTQSDPVAHSAESAGTFPVPDYLGRIRIRSEDNAILTGTFRGFRSCGRRCACPQMRAVAWTEVTAAARVVIPA